MKPGAERVVHKRNAELIISLPFFNLFSDLTNFESSDLPS